MIKTLISKAISTLSLGTDSFDINDVKAWNKKGEYPLTPIQITTDASGVHDNAEDFGKFSEMLEAEANTLIANDGLVQPEEGEKEVGFTTEEAAANIDDTAASIRALQEWFANSRKIQTEPLKKVVSRYTPHEKKLLDIAKSLNNKADELREETYQATETLLLRYINEVIDSVEFEIPETAYNLWLSKKRKSKGVLTGTGKIKKSVMDEIHKLVDDAVKPLQEAKEAKEKAEAEKAESDRQHGAFASAIDSAGTVDALNQLQDNVEHLYPAISDHASARIKQKIGAIQRREEEERLAVEKAEKRQAEADAFAAQQKVKQEQAEAVRREQELAEQQRVAEEATKPKVDPVSEAPNKSEPEAKESISEEVGPSDADKVMEYMNKIVTTAIEEMPTGLDDANGKMAVLVKDSVLNLSRKLNSRYGA